MMKRILDRALRSLTRQSSEASRQRKPRGKPPFCRVMLEQLEERLVLSSDLGLPPDQPTSDPPAETNQAPTVNAGPDVTIVSVLRDQGNPKNAKGVAARGSRRRTCW